MQPDLALSYYLYDSLIVSKGCPHINPSSPGSHRVNRDSLVGSSLSNNSTWGRERVAAQNENRQCSFIFFVWLGQCFGEPGHREEGAQRCNPLPAGDPSKLPVSSFYHYHCKGLVNTCFLYFTLSGYNGPQLKQAGRRFCPLALKVFQEWYKKNEGLICWFCALFFHLNGWSLTWLFEKFYQALYDDN